MYLTAATLVPLSLIACGRSWADRDRSDFERMRVQARYELYGRSHVFPNGQMMQAPPGGTISRESAVDTGVVGTGISNGVPVATIPVVMTEDRLALGERKYTVYCAVCHGAAGFGGSIVAQNMGMPHPTSLRTNTVRGRPAGELFAIVTRGSGRMPSAAWQLTPEERWAVVGYLERRIGTPATTPSAIADSLGAMAIARGDSVLLARQRLAVQRMATDSAIAIHDSVPRVSR